MAVSNLRPQIGHPLLSLGGDAEMEHASGQESERVGTDARPEAIWLQFRGAGQLCSRQIAMELISLQANGWAHIAELTLEDIALGQESGPRVALPPSPSSLNLVPSGRAVLKFVCPDGACEVRCHLEVVRKQDDPTALDGDLIKPLTVRHVEWQRTRHGAHLSQHREYAHNEPDCAVRRTVVQMLGDARALLPSDPRGADRVIAEATQLLHSKDWARTKCHMGGLAPWQLRVVREHVAANIERPLSIMELATLVRLSVGYFTRAFKATVGIPPHQFVILQRIARAKELLLTSDTPLKEIAPLCGLADQSHLTRLFSRREGRSPGAWRRTKIDLAKASVETRSN